MVNKMILKLKNIDRIVLMVVFLVSCVCRVSQFMYSKLRFVDVVDFSSNLIKLCLLLLRVIIVIKVSLMSGSVVWLIVLFIKVCLCKKRKVFVILVVMFRQVVFNIISVVLQLSCSVIVCQNISLWLVLVG